MRHINAQTPVPRIYSRSTSRELGAAVFEEPAFLYKNKLKKNYSYSFPSACFYCSIKKFNPLQTELFELRVAACIPPKSRPKEKNGVPNTTDFQGHQRAVSTTTPVSVADVQTSYCRGGVRFIIIYYG